MAGADDRKEEAAQGSSEESSYEDEEPPVVLNPAVTRPAEPRGEPPKEASLREAALREVRSRLGHKRDREARSRDRDRRRATCSRRSRNHRRSHSRSHRRRRAARSRPLFQGSQPAGAGRAKGNATPSTGSHGPRPAAMPRVPEVRGRWGEWVGAAHPQCAAPHPRHLQQARPQRIVGSVQEACQGEVGSAVGQLDVGSLPLHHPGQEKTPAAVLSTKAPGRGSQGPARPGPAGWFEWLRRRRKGGGLDCPVADHPPGDCSVVSLQPC